MFRDKMLQDNRLPMMGHYNGTRVRNRLGYGVEGDVRANGFLVIPARLAARRIFAGNL